jgi:hypothetical protein
MGEIKMKLCVLLRQNFVKSAKSLSEFYDTIPL